MAASRGGTEGGRPQFVPWCTSAGMVEQFLSGGVPASRGLPYSESRSQASGVTAGLSVLVLVTQDKGTLKAWGGERWTPRLLWPGLLRVLFHLCASVSPQASSTAFAFSLVKINNKVAFIYNKVLYLHTGFKAFRPAAPYC